MYYARNLSMSLGLILTIALGVLNAQNRIPNPSFENLSTCPTHESQIHLAISWSKGCGPVSTNTPDIMATCAIYNPNIAFSDIGVPINAGTRGIIVNGQVVGLMPKHGNNYVHLRRGDMIESVRSNFTQPLALGKEYKIQVWAALTCPTGVNPLVFNQNTGVELRLLNTAPGADNCSTTLTVPLNGTFVRRGEWRLFEATFKVSDLMIAAGMPLEFDDPNNEFGVHRTFRQTFEIRPKANQSGMSENIFIDDLSLVETPCNLNPSYVYAIGCNKKSNQVIIQVAGNVSYTNSMWQLYRMNGNSTLDQNIISLEQTLPNGTNAGQFAVPNIPRAYYMIKRGVWEGHGGCPWAEQRRVFQIPVFNDPVNADFSFSFSSSGAGSPLNLQLTASDPTNTLSAWLMFQSPTDLPPPPADLSSFGGWTLAAIVPNNVPTTNTHTFSGLQSGQYYLVRHYARHNCSQNHFVDKVLYAFQRRDGQMVLREEAQYIQTMEKGDIPELFEALATELENKLVLFPNPASNLLNISLLTNEESHLLITSTDNKVMLDTKVQKQLSIDISSWKAGIYFVRIRNSQGFIQERLLIER